MQRCEIDRVPRMHIVADRSSEKDNVQRIHARVLQDIKEKVGVSDGFTYVASDSKAAPVVELFYDHLCPDSRDDWVTMKQVFEKVKDITGIIHIFPLPYHHNAYFMQQAGVVIRNQGADFVQFMEMVYKEQERFGSGAVNMTEPQVKQMIAEFAATIDGITEQMIMDGYTDSKVVTEARYTWKYGCSQGVSGTPFFMINGVFDPNAGSYTVDDWEKLISRLIAGPP